ncbi:hypothetical protein A3D77_01540 [Candidatus Gottesmanbacteria bacterium RIFCSPHIGHO2_02_FULL_39_11]|uniref:Uncharacterized protein n=1 Tax=Candidatus Gottesmanbacteria bacterium RIFCSPHIGHO2_02_FULL_39_11 TaxID=1798382 RepID=A0A1F5ZU94_9BACT|nr:MAG: hypothetical protein A3D77_01540 [Candidatus Gottesmanbacteria bacterium RIFCSPHIGHO2_02_FULL_39_11]
MKKTLSSAITTLTIAVTSGIVVPGVHAQSNTPFPSGSINIPPPPELRILDLGKLIGSLLSLFLFLAGLIAFVYLLWGGFQWITSGGDKGNIESARNKIQAALLGLLLVFAAYAIFNLVANFLGVPNIFNFNIPSAVQT